MDKKFMTGEDCLQVFKDLARSQGFYGRLYREISTADDEHKEDFFDLMEAQKFRDPVDLIMWVEG